MKLHPPPFAVLKQTGIVVLPVVIAVFVINTDALVCQVGC